MSKAKDIFWKGKIYINVTDIDDGLDDFESFPCPQPHNFTEGEDVTGRYELQYEGFINGAGWGKISKSMYDIGIEKGFAECCRIVALPLPQPPHTENKEAEQGEKELPDDCVSTDDDVCNLPVGSCKQCQGNVKEQRCEYELLVEKYFGLSSETPSGYLMRGLTFDTLVDLVCAAHQHFIKNNKHNIRKAYLAGVYDSSNNTIDSESYVEQIKY